MKNRKIRQLFTGIISSALVFSFSLSGAVIPAGTVSAADTSENISYGTGYVAPEIQVEEIPESTDKPGTGRISSIRKATGYSDNYFSKFSSDYYYKHLNENQKAFYDSLKSSCMKVFSSNANITSVTGDISYLTDDEIKDTYFIFTSSEPEFYFLQNGFIYSYYSNNDGTRSGTATIGVKSKFQSGTARAQATQTFKKNIESILNGAKKYTSTYEKEKFIHDTLAKRLTWDDKDDNENYDVDDKQGADSSLIGTETVCAGYSAAFQILMRGIGVESVQVTSRTHKWNEVRLDGKWYVVDVTFDDPLPYGQSINFSDGSNIQYNYFNVSDSDAKSGNDAHEPESFWDTYGRPVCNNGKFSLEGVIDVQYITMEGSLILDVGESETLSVGFQPQNATDKTLYWMSSDPSIASVDENGKVTANKAGTATITANHHGMNYSSSATCVVTVNKKAVEKISLNKSSLALYEGESETLSATISPDNATDKSISWSSSDNAVATVDSNGHVKAVRIGTVFITATSNSNRGVSASCTLTVNQKVASPDNTPDSNPAGSSDSGSQNTPNPPSAEPSASSQSIPEGYAPTDNIINNPNDVTGASYEWATRDSDGASVVIKNGEVDSNEFISDGTYTYYVQNDGTVMKDRLTYHPDGQHVIFFDSEGHEVFNTFAHASNSIEGKAIPDGEQYYFNVYGYMYVNTVTYDATGTKLYYINPYGQLEHNGWFLFDSNAGYGDDPYAKWSFTGSYLGFANYDATLLTNASTFDYNGTPCYMQGNGEAAY